MSIETSFPSGEIIQSPHNILTRPQPAFAEQAADDTRLGLIISAAEMEHGLGADTSISGNVPEARTYTEHEALAQTRLLLEEAITHPTMPRDIVLRAEDVYENLSFMGDKELKDGAQSIANYWKAYLHDNPHSSIFIITSRTFESEDIELDSEYEVEDADLGHVSANKSDTFIVDHVLSNFSEEELHTYGDRLLLSPAELTGKDPNTIKSVVLDDWIMSGQQIRETLDTVFEHTTPADVEINLVVSNKDRLANGFAHDQEAAIPVKAAFVSHAAQHSYASEFGGAYLTAAHSSGDYPFEATMEAIVDVLNRVSTDTVYMPPLTNIIRPYYAPNYQPRYVERQALVRTIGRGALQNTDIRL